MKLFFRYLFSALAILALVGSTHGQTVLISPSGDGGFETGADFTSNGWTAVNNTTNIWAVGTATFNSGARSAYVSNDAGVTNAYTLTSSQVSHFYRDIAFPAGETAITLTFDWKGQGEGSSTYYDYLRVYVVPTTTTPVAGTQLASGQVGVTYNLQATYTTATIFLPGSLAGTTQRLVFSWRNDGSGGAQPPAAVDNISLVSQLPVPLSGTYTIDNTLPTAGTNFNSWSAANVALTLNGVSGATVFNVTAGQTFTDSVTLTATGTASNTITFQKFGAGSNPVIQRFGTAGSADAVITLSASDYVTFDGINVQQGSGSTAVEYGYYLLGAATDGCKNITVKNSTITLNRANTSSRGVYLSSLASAASGANTTNQFLNNTVQNCYTGYYFNGSSSALDDANKVGISGGTSTVTNLGGSSSAAYGVYIAYQTNFEASNTTFSYIRGTSTVAGIYSGLGANTISVYNNYIDSIYTTSSSSSPYGIYLSTGATNNIYQNIVYRISAASVAPYGIYVLGGTTNNIYSNYVNDINYSGSSSVIAYGVSLAGGTTNNLYNNFIYNIRAVASTGTPGVRALNVSGGTTDNIFFNSVVVSYTATSASNQSAAVYVTTSPTTVDLRNNIFVNKTDVTTGTRAVAHYRSSTTYTNFSPNSNNNIYYAGVASTKNLLFYDGTNSDQTLAAYKTRMATRDQAAMTEDVPFTSAINLHINAAVPTQVEGGGIPVTTPFAITTDIDAQARNASAPDVGADEGPFTGLDLSAPSIAYTALPNISVTGDRTLTATITDLSGVPTAGIGLPVLYWKINNGAYSSATATSIGSNQYQFTFGSGAVLNDVVSYYVCAQDLATSPNVGAYPTGASGFTANPPAASTPPTSPSTYQIVGPPMSGDYTVGATAFNQAMGTTIRFEIRKRTVLRDVEVEVSPETKTDSRTARIEKKEVEEQYSVPMQNGREYTGPFMSPNGVYLTITAATTDAVLRGVSGPVRFLLNDALYAETYPVVIGPIVGTSGTNTVTIRPNVGVTSVISGSSTSSIFKLDGADYVIFDGSNSGGTDRSLTITNTSTATSTGAFWLASAGTGAGATNNTIKNCIISCGADQSTGTNTTFGILTAGSALSATSDGADNNSNTFTNNAFTAVRYGIYLRGAAASSNSNNTISQNIIGPAAFGVSEIGKAGIVLQYQTGAMVSQNEVRFVGGTSALTSSGADRVGIGLGSDSWTATATTVTNSVVTRNLIHDLIEARTFSAAGIILAGSGTPSSNIVANNVIYNVLANGTSGDQAVGIGIGAGDGDKVLFNSISMQGNIDGQGGSTTGTQSGVGIRIASTTPVNLTLKNNAVSVDLTSTTTSINHHVIVAPATSYAWGTGGADYNDYYFNAANTQMRLGGIGTSVPYTAVADLATWKTQFTPAQDATSMSADPQFSGPTNLVPFLGSPILDAGLAGTGITVDYTGATRVDPPSMGAYETGVPSGPPNCATIVSPADAAVNIAQTASVTWANGGGGTLGYKLYFGTSDPPAFVGDLGNVLTYDPPGNLAYSTTYYWKVVAYNGVGDATGCATWSFSTVADPTITVFPYAEGFESLTFPPNGWTNTGAVLWARGTESKYGAGCAKISYSHTGSSTLTSPPVNLPTNHRISFWWKDDDITVANDKSKEGKNPELMGPQIAGHDTTYFEVSIDGGSTWTSLAFLSAASSQSAYSQVIQDLSAYAGNNFYFRFRDVSDGAFAAYGTGVDSITIEQNPSGPPNCATIVGPADAATNVQIADSLRWGAPSGGTTPTGYKLYFGTDNPPTNIVNGTNLGNVLKYVPASALSYLTQYYWKVVPTNADGDATGCAIWSFTTQANPNYGGGGPTSGGYYFANSTPTGGGGGSQPTYSWMDPIALAHTQILDAAWLGGASDPTDDGYFGPVILPFSFTYFGISYSELYIGTNGVIRLGSTPMYTGAYGPATFPNAADTNRNTVAVCWMDLETGASNYPAAGVFYGGDASYFAVTWRNVHDYNSLTDSITCQAIFYPNGNIKMQYNDLLTSIPFPASINNDLISGIENSDGTLGLGYRVNGSGAPVISSPVAVEYGLNPSNLPVQLTSFTARVNPNGAGVRIDWTTASETNNFGFYVQRRVAGSEAWTIVSDLIPGHGTTLDPQVYSYIDLSVPGAGTFQYRLKQVDVDQTVHYVDPIAITLGLTDVTEVAPREFSLKQNYPNPFNPETVIKFSVENTGKTALEVYNLLGQKVATLFDDVAEAGQYYSVRLNGTSLATGMYIYRLQSGTRVDIKKMMLVK